MRTATMLGMLALLALSACSKSHSGSELKVRVITGIVPGPEFNRVETDLFRTVNGNEIALDHADADAYFGLPFARGQIVATFGSAPNEELTVRVRARTPQGAVLVEQRSRFALSADYTLTVFLDRECIAVACPSPGGSAALSACLAGQCVDPRCNPEDESTHQYCPEIEFCNQASECPDVAACATKTCVSGVCVPTQNEAGTTDACAEGEYCNVDATSNACTDVPTTTLPQDASVGPRCGTVCTQAGNVCAVGYWDCSDAGTPTCNNFVFAPMGTTCIDGQCDGVGNCASITTDDGGVEGLDAATSTDAARDGATDAPPVGSVTMTVFPETDAPGAVLEEGPPSAENFMAGGFRFTGAFPGAFDAIITSDRPDICVPRESTVHVTSFSGDQRFWIDYGADDEVLRVESCNITVTTPYGEESFKIRVLDDDYIRITGVAPADSAVSASIGANLVAWASRNDDPSVGDTNGHADVYFFDTTTMTRSMLLTPDDEQPNGQTYLHGLDRTGTRYLIATAATNFPGLAGNLSSSSLLYFDGLSHHVVSERSDHSLSLQGITGPALLTPDAQYIAFTSEDGLLVADDTNGVADVFLYTVATHALERISVDADGHSLSAFSILQSIGEDGRHVVFLTRATELFDESGGSDAAYIVFDRETGDTFSYPLNTGGQSLAIFSDRFLSRDAATWATHDPIGGDAFECRDWNWRTNAHDTIEPSMFGIFDATSCALVTSSLSGTLRGYAAFTASASLHGRVYDTRTVSSHTIFRKHPTEESQSAVVSINESGERLIVFSTSTALEDSPPIDANMGHYYLVGGR